MADRAFVWGDNPHLWGLAGDELMRHVVESLDQGIPRCVVYDSKTSDAEGITIPDDYELLFEAESRSVRHILVRSKSEPTTMVAANHDTSASSFYATGMGLTDELARLAVHAILGPLPPIKANDKSALVHFWSLGQQGAQDRTRRIETNVWDKIENNYAGVTKKSINELLGWTCAPDGGRLMVFHGSPGTGKTHTIRALAHEWRHWCDLHYVVDSEQFFGSASYMLSVLLQGDDDDYSFPEADGSHPSNHKENRWRLIVVEDADELLRRDAKNVAGQNLSRLLNLCDGLIGQGLRVLVLLTTNEPLNALHPAIIRPGRCVAEINFAALTPAEATAWLGGPVTKNTTIAELYEMNRHEKVSQAPADPVHTGAYL